MSRSSFGFRRSFNTGRKLSRENRKEGTPQQQGQTRSDHNDLHEKRQRSRHDNSEADKAARSIFGDVPLTDTERRYLWAAQSGNLPALEMLVEEAGTFNLSCRDYLGRTALQLAVLGEHYDCIQLLLDKSRLDVIEEGLLHAIKTENVKICDMFLSHPVYSDQRSRMQLEFQHGFYEQEDSSSSFAPDITPIVLAAQCNNFDIVHMLIQKGFTIPTPHNYFCLCTECYNHKNFDRVVHSKSRLNAYRGLASTAYLSLSCDDPIYAAFELSRSLQKLADREKEHKNEYRGLSDKCKNFAVDLLDQCRTNDEVMAALHGGTDTRDLSRIKMAIRYEQKKFIAHASCQEHLASMWYAGASWFQHQNFPIKLIMVPLGILFIPVTAIVYVFLPYSRIGKILKSPFMKFMNYICSYTAFLVLLFLGTQLSSFKSSHLFGGTEGVVNGLIMFYVLGMFWAECKQLWEEGVKGYFSQMWNYMDITMLALYTAGYSTEGVIYTKTNGYITENNLIHSEDETILNPQILSKVLFSVANVMSFARIAYILPASETFGQLQISYGRMLQDVGKFIFIYVTVMIAFICGLTSLYSISRNEHFSGLVETTSTLFWAAFGMGNSKAPEIAEEDDDTGNSDNNQAPADANEITDKELLAVIEVVGYILYGVYILGAVVVLINMLIAMMSNTFEDIQKSEDSEWKFARAKLWISFIEQGTTLPIPFNIIPTPKSILKLCRWFRDFICCGEDKHKSGRGDSKQYELEYKAIMHRVVLRFIHKMKFERKGESLKDEILDTREEVIFQMHSMFGRLAARLELLEKDVFALTKAGWTTRDGTSSPARSSLSYSRSVPTHPRDTLGSSFLSGSDNPRESYLVRRRSYYHERPKREILDGPTGRTSLEERYLKGNSEKSDLLSPGTPQPGNTDHHDNEANMSDGDKRIRKPSPSQPLGGNVNSSNNNGNGGGDNGRKESVVSSGSAAHSDTDEYVIGRRDSYRMRPTMDGGISPRPGGERRGRDDSLRGSRKRDGYGSNPRWNQGVIKESSLEDQVSNNGERETSFSGFRHTGSLGKRRETYNHPNIDAPFGLPSSDPRAHTTNFTEYMESKPARRDTIQNLVLDVHQVPFSRIESSQPARSNHTSDTLLSPKSENSRSRSHSRSDSPLASEAELKKQRLNFAQKSQNSLQNNSKTSNDEESNKNNDDGDNEDQYAKKLANVSQKAASRSRPGTPDDSNKSQNPISTHLSKTGSKSDKQENSSDLEPLRLTHTEASQIKPGRKIGRANLMFIPEVHAPQSGQHQEGGAAHDQHGRTNTHSNSPNSPSGPIFFTNISHEVPSHFHSTLTSEDHFPRLPTIDVRDFHNRQRNTHSGVAQGDFTTTQITRNPSSDSSSYPIIRPPYFGGDNISRHDNSSRPTSLSTSTDQQISLQNVHMGFLNPGLVREEEDRHIDRSRSASPFKDSASAKEYSECAPYKRPSPLKKRESLPVIGMASKHQRMLHVGRDSRPRYSIPCSTISDHTPHYTSSSSSWYHQQHHHPINVDADIMSGEITTQEYDVIPSAMIIPPMATNLNPFPLPIQANDVFARRQPHHQQSVSDSEQGGGGGSDGNEKATPKHKSPRTKKTSIVSLVRGRLSDKVKGKQPGIKHNRSLSLNRFSGSRGDRLSTLHTQRSKEV